MFSKYSSMVRLNQRYRGPMESDKLNRTNKAAEYDVMKLMNATTDLSNRLAALRQLSNFGTDIEHPGIIPMTQRMQTAQLSLGYIKEDPFHA